MTQSSPAPKAAEGWESINIYRCICCGRPADDAGNTHCSCAGILYLRDKPDEKSVATAKFWDAESQRQVRSAEVAKLLQAISQNATTFQNQQQDRTRALDTRQGFGNALFGLLPPTPAQTGPLPPAPGQPSVARPPAPSPGALPQPMPDRGPAGQPQAMPNAGGSPAGPSTANMGGPAAPAQIPPYRGIPEPQPAGGPPGSIPPPPAAPPQPEIKLPSPMTFLAKIKEAGVDPGKAADYLDQYAPLYKAQQEQEFKQMQAELRAQAAAITAYKAALEGKKAEREDKRLEQGDRRLDLQEGRDQKNAERMDALIAKMNRPAASGSKANALDADDIKFMANQYLAGDRTVLQNLGRGVQGAEDLRALRKAIRTEAQAKGMTPEHTAIKIAEFEGLKAGERTAGTREAQLGFAAHELEQFLPLAEAASKKVPRTDFKPLNALIQAGENQWSPEQAAFVAANRSVINAFSMVASRGAQTVHNVQEAEKMLNTAASHDVYKAVLDQLDKEVKGALKAPGQVRADLADRGTKPGTGAALPATNAKGWMLKKDAAGRQAYVSPDGKQFEEVK